MNTETEEPEIVECEILKCVVNGLLYDKEGDGMREISSAIDDPDFIGFKCDGWIWGRAYKNKDTGNMVAIIPANQLDEFEVCDMTQGHVLFRRQK